jgi:hypothetical protein
MDDEPTVITEWAPFTRPDGSEDALLLTVLIGEHGISLWKIDYGPIPGLGPEELGALPWARLMDIAVATSRARQRGRAAAAAAGTPGNYDIRVTTDDEAWARELRRRNRLTDDDLDRVAELYLQGGTAMVAELMHVSRRQASRYVNAARERGLLT